MQRTSPCSSSGTNLAPQFTVDQQAVEEDHRRSVAEVAMTMRSAAAAPSTRIA